MHNAFFLAFVLQLRHETSQFHAPALWRRWTRHEKFFRYLNTIFSDSTPENFDSIWQIKWNWIRWVKIEIVRIHFLRFRFVVIQKWLPWPRDVTTSPLYTRCYSPANADVFPVFASPKRKVTFRVKRSDDRKYVCIRRLRCYLCSSLQTSRFFEQGAFLDRKLWTKGENIGGAQSRCVDLWDQHMFWKNPIPLCWS